MVYKFHLPLFEFFSFEYEVGYKTIRINLWMVCKFHLPLFEFFSFEYKDGYKVNGKVDLEKSRKTLK